MAGGANAAAVMCLRCLGRADRVSEGLETDAYVCTVCGQQSAIDWSAGQPPAPCWPPSDAALAEAQQVRALLAGSGLAADPGPPPRRSWFVRFLGWGR